MAQVGSTQVGHLEVYVAQIQAGEVGTVEVKTLAGDKIQSGRVFKFPTG